MINKKFISPLSMWLIIVAGLLVIINFAPAKRLLENNVFTSILVVSAVIYWLYFFSLAIFVNRRAASGSLKTEKLIRHGVYGMVRHPIYAADIILAWGIFLFWPTTKALMAVIWLNAVLFYWMRLEEKILTEKFGRDYEEYKRTVPMFFPKLKNKK